LFAVDQKAEKGRIERAARYLNAHPQIQVLVEGYADERGSVGSNIGLGENWSARLDLCQ